MSSEYYNEKVLAVADLNARAETAYLRKDVDELALLVCELTSLYISTLADLAEHPEAKIDLELTAAKTEYELGRVREKINC